jgi:hypothetical protein
MSCQHDDLTSKFVSSKVENIFYIIYSGKTLDGYASMVIERRG